MCLIAEDYHGNVTYVNCTLAANKLHIKSVRSLRRLCCFAGMRMRSGMGLFGYYFAAVRTAEASQFWVLGVPFPSFLFHIEHSIQQGNVRGCSHLTVIFWLKSRDRSWPKGKICKCLELDAACSSLYIVCVVKRRPLNILTALIIE